MKKIALVVILILIKTLAFTQINILIPQIRQTVPMEIQLLNIPDTGNYSYITLMGTNLDKISDLRISKNKVIEKGIKAEKLNFKKYLNPKDKASSQSRSPDKYLVIKINPISKLTYGEYILEVYANGKWIDTNCKINVKERLADKIKLSSSIKSSIKDNFKFRQNELIEIKRAMSAIEKQEIKINSSIIKKSESVASNIKIDTSFITAEIFDYYPKEKAQLDGYIVIIGKNLDSIKEMKIGDVRISKQPEKKLVEGSYQKYIYFTGYSALSGKLILTIPQKIGFKVVYYDQTLENNYQLVDRNQMNPTVKLVRVYPWYSRYNDRNTYPYQIVSLHLKVENVPGNYFSENEVSVIKYNRFINNEIARFDVDEVFLDTNHLFYGNTFDIYIIEKSTSESSLNVSLKFKFKDTHKSGFGSYKTISYAHPLAPRVIYTIEDTYSLFSKLNFGQVFNFGTGSGTSEGPNPFSSDDDIRVGLMELDNDFAFKIASGPLGTQAVWKSDAILLNDGWSVEAITFDATREKPDNTIKTYFPGGANGSLLYTLMVGQTNLGRDVDIPFFATDNTFDDNLMFSIDKTVEACDGTILENELVNSSSDIFLRPILVDLRADQTGYNDHRITVKIKRIVLKGPPNRNISEAFSPNYIGSYFNYWLGGCSNNTIVPVHFY
ncbi:MAG: hypothetical protein IPJ86_04410 [Bacteroidetes bacterium]|nr:hypothetical protein [Bacteroidota bacterium]